MYLRQPAKSAEPAARKTNDYFLGAVKIQPNFDNNRVEDQLLNFQGGTGSIHVQLCYKPQQVIVALHHVRFRHC